MSGGCLRLRSNSCEADKWPAFPLTTCYRKGMRRTPRIWGREGGTGERGICEAMRRSCDGAGPRFRFQRFPSPRTCDSPLEGETLAIFLAATKRNSRLFVIRLLSRRPLFFPCSAYLRCFRGKGNARHAGRSGRSACDQDDVPRHLAVGARWKLTRAYTRQ